MSKKVCPQCGKEFQASDPEEVFCSARCAIEARNAAEEFNGRPPSRIIKAEDLQALLRDAQEERKKSD